VLFRQQRGPQSGVPGTHDAEIGAQVTDQRGMWLRLQRVRVQPPQFGLYFGEMA